MIYAFMSKLSSISRFSFLLDIIIHAGLCLIYNFFFLNQSWRIFPFISLLFGFSKVHCVRLTFAIPDFMEKTVKQSATTEIAALDITLVTYLLANLSAVLVGKHLKATPCHVRLQPLIEETVHPKAAVRTVALASMTRAAVPRTGTTQLALCFAKAGMTAVAIIRVTQMGTEFAIPRGRDFQTAQLAITEDRFRTLSVPVMNV